jgi:23S rRNA pseudouridine1911/1915/1917 synthase
LTHESFVVTPEDIAVQKRLDRILARHYPDSTRSHLQLLIARGLITVNKKQVKSGYQPKPQDVIEVVFPDPEPSGIEPQDIPIRIIYEDDALLVIDKPAGLVVHPGAGNYSGTLVNALLYHCRSLSGINGVLRPGIVHRLDKNTSGLMVVAKNDQSHQRLAQQFETRNIIRTYQALVWGVPDLDQGEIATRIDRQLKDRKKMSVSTGRGKTAITRFRVVKRYRYFSLLELHLKTGRTHQIRVHLKHIHHPVFGDPEYDGRRSQLGRITAGDQKTAAGLLKLIDRQALHAWRLSFIHPETGERVTFESEIPADIRAVLAALDNG